MQNSKCLVFNKKTPQVSYKSMLLICQQLLNVFKNMIGFFLLSFKKEEGFFLGQICGCSEARLSCVASHFSQHVALLHDHPKVPPLHNGAELSLKWYFVSKIVQTYCKNFFFLVIEVNL